MKIRILLLINIFIALSLLNGQPSGDDFWDVHEFLTTDCGFGGYSSKSEEEYLEKYSKLPIKTNEIINTFNIESVEAYRESNPPVFRMGLMINDTDRIRTINLYHPDDPQGGVFSRFDLTPGQKISLWEGKYSISNDWGIELIDYIQHLSPICFIGDISEISQEFYIIYISSLLTEDVHVTE